MFVYLYVNVLNVLLVELSKTVVWDKFFLYNLFMMNKKENSYKNNEHNPPLFNLLIELVIYSNQNNFVNL